MANLDIQAGWGYQNATKHSHHSVRTNPHFLDWANQPLPFKIYPKLDLVPLPREFRESGVPALLALWRSPAATCAAKRTAYGTTVIGKAFVLLPSFDSTITFG